MRRRIGFPVLIVAAWLSALSYSNAQDLDLVGSIMWTLLLPAPAVLLAAYVARGRGSLSRPQTWWLAVAVCLILMPAFFVFPIVAPPLWGAGAVLLLVAWIVALIEAWDSGDAARRIVLLMAATLLVAVCIPQLLRAATIVDETQVPTEYALLHGLPSADEANGVRSAPLIDLTFAWLAALIFAYTPLPRKRTDNSPPLSAPAPLDS